MRSVELDTNKWSQFFILVLFWYFWLTIQNTTTSQVRNPLSVIAVFISFPLAWRAGGTQSLAVGPRIAGSSDQVLASRAFPLQKKEKKKKKKKRQRKKE